MGEQRNISDADLREPFEHWQENEGQVFGGGYSYGRSERQSVGDAGSEMLRMRHRPGTIDRSAND